MYKAAEAGLIQAMIGQSALAFQEKVETGEEKVIGVNCYQADNVAYAAPPTERPDVERMTAARRELYRLQGGAEPDRRPPRA